MAECKNTGCNLCNPDVNADSPSAHGCGSHPEVTDIRNRELILFGLVILFMIVIGIAGGVIYDKYVRHPQAIMVMPDQPNQNAKN